MNRRQFIKHGAVAGATAPWVRAPMAFAAQAGAGTPLLNAGFAERDITPEIGMEQPGGYGKSYHTKLHDVCKARIAVFDDGKGKRVALVGLDALTVPRHLVLAARKGIQEECGIPPEAVLISASHSHSSGPISMVQPAQYDYASPLVQKLAYEKSTCANPRYLELVRKQIIAGVREANDARAEAHCSVGSGTEDKVAFNRRLRMKNGLTYSHPGQGNPDVIGFAGPIDPEVGVIGAWDKNGKLMGCIVNYCCHATTNPGGISANWIYYLEKTIRGELGPEVIVVYMQGDCGDVTQVDNLSQYRAQRSEEEWARFVGGRVGAETVKVLVTAYPGSLSPLNAASTVLNIKRRVPSPERAQRSTELVQKDPKEVGDTEWTFAKEVVLLNALLERYPAAEVEVQAIQVGPAVFVSNPAELF